MNDTEKAYEAIKESILTLALPPGSVINARDLAANLNLGRTPVRDALKQLEADHLVVTVHRRGTSVADISLTDLRQLYEVRQVVEPACAFWAAKRMDANSIAEIRSLVEDILHTDPGDNALLLRKERHIHRLIARGSGNKYLETEACHYYDLSARIWYMVLNQLTSDVIDIRGHSELMEAIACRDADAAATLMRQHVDVFYRELKAII